MPEPSFEPQERVRDILRRKKGSSKNAPLGQEAPSWAEIQDHTWQEVEAGARQNKPGYRTIKKLLSDSRLDR
jgi:hypothetical protein